MPDLANLDQALMAIWEKVVKEQPAQFKIEDAVIEFGRRAFAMAEKKEELARQFIK